MIDGKFARQKKKASGRVLIVEGRQSFSITRIGLLLIGFEIKEVQKFD